MVNVPESAIARESDAVLPTLAGPEIGVASTKAFTTQLTVLACMALAAGHARGALDDARVAGLSAALLEVPARAAEILKSDGQIERVAHEVAEARDVLYLGRGSLYPIALEGALKLKEISYIHAEGYAAGEMKHGPIALIEEGVPIVVCAPSGPLFDKTASNIEEVIARGGQVVLFSDAEGCRRLGPKVHHAIVLPTVDPFVAPLLYALPVQLLAYHAAVAKGTDVDQPRNLGLVGAMSGAGRAGGTSSRRSGRRPSAIAAAEGASCAWRAPVLGRQGLWRRGGIGEYLLPRQHRRTLSMSLPKTLLQMAGAPATPHPLAESALLLIDLQNEYRDGKLPLPGVQGAVEEAAALLARARAAGRPVIHVRHCGRVGGAFDPSTAAFSLVAELTPRQGESVIDKTLPNAFAKTPLEATLRALGVTSLIVGGLMTHMCVSSTVRAALDLGFGCTVVADACATRDLPDGTGGVVSAADLHRAELAALSDRFAIVAKGAASLA